MRRYVIEIDETDLGGIVDVDALDEMLSRYRAVSRPAVAVADDDGEPVGLITLFGAPILSFVAVDPAEDVAHLSASSLVRVGGRRVWVER
jgi:hypothetical protein